MSCCCTHFSCKISKHQPITHGCQLHITLLSKHYTQCSVVAHTSHVKSQSINTQHTTIQNSTHSSLMSITQVPCCLNTTHNVQFLHNWTLRQEPEAEMGTKYKNDLKYKDRPTNTSPGYCHHNIILVNIRPSTEVFRFFSKYFFVFCAHLWPEAWCLNLQ